MNYQQYIYDEAIKPILLEQYLNTLPRWRRPLVRIGRAYRKFTYEKIEAPWGAWLVQRFFPEILQKNCPSTRALEVSQTHGFKLLEYGLWKPVRYVLHPMLFLKLGPKITREWRKQWLRTASPEDKLRDWERRMLKGGPMPVPSTVKNTEEIWQRLSAELPTAVFEETAYTLVIKNPGFVHGLGYVVELFDSQSNHQGFLYENGQISIFKDYVKALVAGEDFLHNLQEKKKELAAEQQRLSEQAIWGTEGPQA